MFTAQNAQMPIRQISCKSSDFFAYTQEKRAKVYFWARFSCIWAALCYCTFEVGEPNHPRYYMVLGSYSVSSISASIFSLA